MAGKGHRKGTPYDEVKHKYSKKNKKKKKKINLNSTFKFGRTNIKGFRLKIILRDSYKCAYCSIDNVLLEIEHIIPKSKGGRNNLKNLVLSCRECNLKKGNQLPLEIKDDGLREKVIFIQKSIKYSKRH